MAYVLQMFAAMAQVHVGQAAGYHAHGFEAEPTPVTCAHLGFASSKEMTERG